MNLFGNGRNNAVGPGLINIDFSVFRNNYIETNPGSLNIRLRAEFFNILNHANLHFPLNTATLTASPSVINPLPRSRKHDDPMASLQAGNGAHDPASKLIFTFNGDSKNATVIDPVKETVAKVVDMGGVPEPPIADGKGTIYDNNRREKRCSCDRHKDLDDQRPLAGSACGSAGARDMDRKHRRLFSSGRDPKFLVLMDADSGRVLQSLPSSSGADANVFESETGLLFVSTRAGKLHIFHEDSPDKLSEVETVETEFGATTMNIDPKTHNFFLITADFGSPGPAIKKHPHPQRAPTPGAFRVSIYGR